MVTCGGVAAAVYSRNGRPRPKCFGAEEKVFSVELTFKIDGREVGLDKFAVALVARCLEAVRRVDAVVSWLFCAIESPLLSRLPVLQ